MPNQSKQPIEIFISYAHKDEALLLLLHKHLRPLRDDATINTWYDQDINAGADFAEEIDKHLNSAQIILLLVSANFLASDYCYSIEMERAMERQRRGEAIVIPVILRPCEWSNAPFSRLQALPRAGRPVTNWRNRDAAFADVVRGIREAAEQLMPTFPPKPRLNYVIRIEMTLDRPLEQFNEVEFKDTLRDVLGVDIQKVRIAGIERGSTKIRLEGDDEELTRLVVLLQQSKSLQKKMSQTTGLMSFSYYQDGKLHKVQVKQEGPTERINRQLLLSSTAALLILLIAISLYLNQSPDCRNVQVGGFELNPFPGKTFDNGAAITIMPSDMRTLSDELRGRVVFTNPDAAKDCPCIWQEERDNKPVPELDRHKDCEFTLMGVKGNVRIIKLTLKVGNSPRIYSFTINLSPQ
jgi:hypothetical protein